MNGGGEQKQTKNGRRMCVERIREEVWRETIIRGKKGGRMIVQQH